MSLGNQYIGYDQRGTVRMVDRRLTYLRPDDTFNYPFEYENDAVDMTYRSHTYRSHNNDRVISSIPIDDVNEETAKCSFCNKTGHSIISCDDPQFNLVSLWFIDKFLSIRQKILDANFIDVLEESYIYIENVMVKYIVGEFDLSSQEKKDTFEMIKKSLSETLQTLEKKYLKVLCIDLGIENIHHVKSKLIQYIVDYVMKNCFPTKFKIGEGEGFTYTIVGTYSDYDLLKYFVSIIQEYKHSIYRVINNKDLELPESIECPICYETIHKKMIIQTKCNHTYCRPCVREIINTTKKCAMCRCDLGDELYCNNIDMDKNMYVYLPTYNEDRNFYMGETYTEIIERIFRYLRIE